ncbi:Hypothetical protein A7982_01253 [Minicystis rosea]|nr:Hypothetical protein A7982_01253 [Minicystis rosea]
MSRLGLAGYDNASILQADAWVDSPEFRAAWEHQDAALTHDLGAYLGEAIIRRHGGKWSFAQPGPVVEIKCNGLHIVDPFGKVRKRFLNGSVDQLLALVNLVEHVAARPALDASAVVHAATAALQASDKNADMGLGIGWLFFALIGFPLLLLVVLLFLIDTSYALIGGACGIPLGLAGLVVALRLRAPKAPTFPPGTLAFEAQLTLPPLQHRLLEKLDALGGKPAPEALAEVVFYTRQLGEVRAIIDRRDASPGRGYVGFDTFGAADSSWSRRGDQS